MKNIFLTFVVMLFSFVASAKETWVIKDMPEVKYMYRAVVGKPDGTKSAATAKELAAEAKKLELVHSKTVFYKLDLVRKASTEAGLEVSGPNLAKVPANLLKTRPAGKYLIGHFAGKETWRLYKSIVPTFRDKKLTPLAPPTGYVYSKNAGTDKATLILVIPLK